MVPAIEIDVEYYDRARRKSGQKVSILGFREKIGEKR